MKPNGASSSIILWGRQYFHYSESTSHLDSHLDYFNLGYGIITKVYFCSRFAGCSINNDCALKVSDCWLLSISINCINSIKPINETEIWITHWIGRRSNCIFGHIKNLLLIYLQFVSPISSDCWSLVEVFQNKD